MELKKNNKKITTKDYLIVIALFIITGFLIILLANYYKDYRIYYRSIPVINGYINEISESELDNYITANSITYIYMAEASDSRARNLEKDLKKFIKKYNLKDKVAYINLEKIKNKNKFIDSFNNKYNINEEINNYPIFIIMRDMRVLDLVQNNEEKNIHIEDIKGLLEKYNLLGD